MVLYPCGTSTAIRIGKSDPGNLWRTSSPAIASAPAATNAPASSNAARCRKECSFIRSPQFLHVVGRQGVGVAVAEIRPHEIHHGGHLCVIEIAAERRHAILAVEDDERGVRRRGQARILRERGIAARTLRALGVCHVTALADPSINLLA